MPRHRLFPWLLLALAAILYFSDLSGKDLWEPNEPTYAEAAREMAAGGSQLLPTVNGEPYPGKPPLLFWSIELASLPGGQVTAATARVPSALAATLLVLAVYFLSRRALGDRGAFLSAATLAVSSLFVEQARYAQPDVLLTLGVGVGILSLFRLMDGPPGRTAWVLLAAASMALGLMAKGPVALLLPALVVGADSMLERPRPGRLKWAVIAGLLALIPPALYYTVLARAAGAGAVKEFFLRENVERYVAGFDNLQPWWYYLAHSPADLLPVTLLLPAALFHRPADPSRARFHRRLWIWLALVLIFFSVSTSKRPVYLLPLFPAAALLCGSLLDHAAEWRARRRTKIWAHLGEGATLALLGVAGLVAPLLAHRKAPGLLPAALALCLLAVAGSAAGWWKLVHDRLLAAHGSLLLTLALIWIVCTLEVYPFANRINSPRRFAESITRSVPASAPLDSYGLYRWRSGYIFYARRRMPRLPDTAALDRFLESDRRVYCILPERSCDRVRARLHRPIYVLSKGRAGHLRDCLISNRPVS